MDKDGVPSVQMPANLADAIEIALESDPALIASRLASKAAGSGVDVARAAYYPRFELSAESEYREDSDGIEGKITENRVLIRMDYAFDLAYSKKNAVAAARARQSAATYRSAHQERITRESVQNAWEEYETAQRRLEVAMQQVEMASKFLELAEQERDMGKRTLQDILSGELIRLSARTSAAQARVDVSIAAHAILRSIGRLEL
jgi:adhesin transport system outer membrane protein